MAYISPPHPDFDRQMYSFFIVSGTKIKSRERSQKIIRMFRLGGTLPDNARPGQKILTERRLAPWKTAQAGVF